MSQLDYGRKRDPAAWAREVCRNCGHGRYEHLLPYVGGDDDDRTGPCRSPGCSCPEYRRKGSIPRKRKQSIVKEAKSAERDFAVIMGGERLPSTGQPQKPDVDGGWWVMEVKHRRIPKWIVDALDQATLAARGRKGAPLALVGLKDKPGLGKAARYLLLMEPADFVQWNGKGSDGS